MCNEYEFETKWEEHSRIMAREALDLPARQAAADLLLSPSIKIGDTATVIRAARNGVELAPMTFGFHQRGRARARCPTSSRRAGTLPTAIGA